MLNLSSTSYPHPSSIRKSRFFFFLQHHPRTPISHPPSKPLPSVPPKTRASPDPPRPNPSRHHHHDHRPPTRGPPSAFPKWPLPPTPSLPSFPLVATLQLRFHAPFQPYLLSGNPQTYNGVVAARRYERYLNHLHGSHGCHGPPIMGCCVSVRERDAGASGGSRILGWDGEEGVCVYGFDVWDVDAGAVGVWVGFFWVSFCARVCAG